MGLIGTPWNSARGHGLDEPKTGIEGEAYCRLTKGKVSDGDGVETRRGVRSTAASSCVQHVSGIEQEKEKERSREVLMINAKLGEQLTEAEGLRIDGSIVAQISEAAAALLLGLGSAALQDCMGKTQGEGLLFKGLGSRQNRKGKGHRACGVRRGSCPTRTRRRKQGGECPDRRARLASEIREREREGGSVGKDGLRGGVRPSRPKPREEGGRKRETFPIFFPNSKEVSK